MKIKTVLIALVCTVTVVALASFAFVEHQKARFYGGLTNAVDRSQFTGQVGSFLISNVAVLSEDGKTMDAGRSVLIRNGRIAQIAAAEEMPTVPQDAVKIDGAGKFLIPGLIDSHVHLERRSNDLLVMLAHGITYVREMGGSTPSLEMRKATQEGAAGPHMYVASRKIYGDAGLYGLLTEWTRTRINISDPDDADGVVRKLAEDGYDAVKIGGFTSSEVHRAVLEAARKYGIDAIGHLQEDASLEDLYDTNQRELSHVEEITKVLIAERGGYKPEEADAFLAYIRSRADDVGVRLRDADIAVGTSIALMDSLPRQKFDLRNALADTDLRYVDPGQVEGTMLTPGWLEGQNIYAASPDELGDAEAARAWWNAYVEAVHIMAEALSRNGATVLAGTDVGTPVLVPGQSLHTELAALVASGLSEAEALRSATAAPGKWLGKPVGRISPGYAADLVLLDADPLAEIANTRRIDAVFVDGRLFRRKELDRMLAAVEFANYNSRS